MLPDLTPDEIKRFWSKVDRSGGPDACWPWTGIKSNGGYGIFQVTRSGRVYTISAHRLALILGVGPVPDNRHACHDCPGGDNKLCCNPDHLFAATPRQNTRDMMRKERARFDFKERPEAVTGERNVNAKLTADDVRAIRAAAAAGESFNAIGRRFGVTGTNIADVVKRRTWRHVA